jgi:hypothetical protein
MKLFSQHNIKPFDNGLNNIKPKIIRKVKNTSCMMNELFTSTMDKYYDRHKKYIYPFGSGIMDIKIIKSKMGESTIKMISCFPMNLSIPQKWNSILKLKNK